MIRRTKYFAMALLLFSGLVGQVSAQEDAAANSASGLTIIILLAGLGMVVVVGGYMVMREGNNDTDQ